MTARVDDDTRRLNAFTGLAARGCALDGERKKLGFDEVLPEMSRAFADLPPDTVEELCRRWIEGPDGRWFPSEHALRRMAPRQAVAVRGDPGPAWKREADDAIGRLANCFLRRIQQLEPADHERFGRELAAWSPGRTPRETERWVAEWLGTDWWTLMGAAKPAVETPKGWKGGA